MEQNVLERVKLSPVDRNIPFPIWYFEDTDQIDLYKNNRPNMFRDLIYWKYCNLDHNFPTLKKEGSNG